MRCPPNFYELSNYTLRRKKIIVCFRFADRPTDFFAKNATQKFFSPKNNTIQKLFFPQNHNKKFFPKNAFFPKKHDPKFFFPQKKATQKFFSQKNVNWKKKFVTKKKFATDRPMFLGNKKTNPQLSMMENLLTAA